jgi:hypothetical protein
LNKNIALGLGSSLMIAGLAGVGGAAVASPDKAADTKIVGCHSAGQSGKYTVIEADDHSDHSRHEDDILVSPVSQNLGLIAPLGVTGQSILDNGCVVPEPTATSTPVQTEAASPASTPSETATDTPSPVPTKTFVEVNPCLGLTDEQCAAAQSPTSSATPTCSSFNNHSCEPGNTGPTAAPSTQSAPPVTTVVAEPSSTSAVSTPSQAPSTEPSVSGDRLAETASGADLLPFGLAALAAFLGGTTLLVAAKRKSGKHSNS